MNDPAILFVKPKAISQRDKKLLREAGVIVIEIENVADAKFIRAGMEIGSSDMLIAASNAIANCGSGYAKQLFADAICAAIDATRS